MSTGHKVLGMNNGMSPKGTRGHWRRNEDRGGDRGPVPGGSAVGPPRGEAGGVPAKAAARCHAQGELN